MDKIILNILKKLEKNGYEAYIVGGFVRDRILSIDTNDIDICTNALPQEVKKIFNLNKVIKDEFGSINIKIKKYNIDITTFREESNYNKHIPKNINYVKNVLVDIKRRDFTINSILMNSKCELIDYCNGMDDINKKIIKCIGDTNNKLKEDPLRILRAIRLSIKLNFRLDEDIIKFIKNNKKILENLSFYRKKEELDKILYSTNKLKGLEILKELGLDSVLNIKYDKIKYSKDMLGMYAQIEFSDNYPLTKNEKDIIKKIREILSIGNIDNYIIYKYGLYISSIAGEILGIDYKTLNKMYKALPIKSRKDLKIDVESIVKLNNNCYNNINLILNELEKNIAIGNIKNKRSDIIKFLRK